MPFNQLRGSILFIFLWLSCLNANAAYISRAELTDFNFANANICEKTPLRLKFDFENFNPGNVFTAEIALNGNFSPANTIVLVGSVSQSGNQQNFFLTVNFPATVQPNVDYRLRVRGSNPSTVANDLNSFSFRISKFLPTDQNFYPQGFWRGYFYTWTPSTTGTINDATNEDIFNPTNYVGYIAEDSLSFDFNWGNSMNAPSNLPDTSKVCGSYRDFFSIRMRRRINFEAGYYIIGGGADDGFRFSLDGGATWLISDWNDHAYRGSMQNNGCGVQLTAGVRDVVVEFYENKTDARFRLILKKTGDPAPNPQITFPANGAIICASQGPIQMTATPPGALQWSGTGVAANGVLNPGFGGTGPRTITYQTGFNAFGQNCLKTTSITVNIQPGLSAEFSGLNPEYCIQPSSTVTLTPQNTGGTFSGPGVTGNIFDPSVAGAGTHTITHIINTPGGCNDTVSKQVTVFAPVTPVITNLPQNICSGTPPFTLSGVPAGGVFSGMGVSGNLFNPALAQNGLNIINYTVVNGPCVNIGLATINIGQNGNTTLTASRNSFCFQSAQKVKLNAFPPNGTYLSSPGVQGDSLNTSQLALGSYTISYVAGTGTCLDTANFTFTVNPLPNASFQDLPDTVCEGSADLILVPLTPGGNFQGQGVIPPNRFSPSILLVNNTYEVKYFVTVNGCTNSSAQFVNILDKLKPTVTFGSIKSLYCETDGPFTPISNPPCKFFLNGNEVTEVNPSALGPGNYAIRAVYRPDSPLECIDSSSALFRFSVIANPKPNLGPDLEVESGMALNLDPKVQPPYQWQILPASNGTGENDKILSFKPVESGSVQVTAFDPTRTCSGTDFVTFIVRPPLSFPNLFTPNNDGKNDFWQISGAYNQMKVSIFDRWGKEIYSGRSDGELAWDGDEAKEGGLYFFLVEHPTDGRTWNGWLMVNK
jgi:gliding motility-associated-like protein